MEIKLVNGSVIRPMKSNQSTRGNRSKDIEWSNSRYLIDFLLMYGFDIEELNKLSEDELEKLVEKVAEPFVTATEMEGENVLKDHGELAEIISEHLPISTEDAYSFIDAVCKAYTWGNVDYAMAMSMRDGVIDKLMKENKMLMRKNDLLMSKLANDYK